MMGSMLRWILAFVMFFFVIQIEIGSKTIERHLMSYTLSQTIASITNTVAHEIWRLSGIVFRHSQEAFREALLKGETSVKGGK